VNNSSLLALEKFHRRDLNLRPTVPESGTLSTQPLNHRVSFLKFKMVAAAMLDYGNQAFFDATYEFLFKVSTFLLKLMKID